MDLSCFPWWFPARLGPLGSVAAAQLQRAGGGARRRRRGAAAVGAGEAQPWFERREARGKPGGKPWKHGENEEKQWKNKEEKLAENLRKRGQNAL